MPRVRVLTDRELTVSLLARQLLLARRRLPAAQAVRRLVALQAQYSPSPYLALHARLDGFAIGELERALRAGTVVKATLMRGTLHLVHADAYPAYAAAWHHQARRQLRGRGSRADGARGAERGSGRDAGGGWAGGADAAQAADAAALEAYLAEPRTTDALRAFTRELAGERIGERLGPLDYARMLVPCVHVPPSGLWRRHGRFSLVAWRTSDRAGAGASAAPRQPVPRDPAAGTIALVRDYLAAFGPATREDLAAFSFLRFGQLDAALAALEPLRRLTDAQGRELLDLPRAPLPREDVATPVRFLPKWDAALISHRDRSRVLPAGFLPVVKEARNGEVLPTYLIEGQVAGTWSHEESEGVATLTLRSLTGADALAPGLEPEARRLLAFLSPGAARRELARG